MTPSYIHTHTHTHVCMEGERERERARERADGEVVSHKHVSRDCSLPITGVPIVTRTLDSGGNWI